MSRASRHDERADCAQRCTRMVHWRLEPYETNAQQRRRVHDENAAGRGRWTRHFRRGTVTVLFDWREPLP